MPFYSMMCFGETSYSRSIITFLEFILWRKNSSIRSHKLILCDRSRIRLPPKLNILIVTPPNKPVMQCKSIWESPHYRNLLSISYPPKCSETRQNFSLKQSNLVAKHCRIWIATKTWSLKKSQTPCGTNNEYEKSRTICCLELPVSGSQQ